MFLLKTAEYRFNHVDLVKYMVEECHADLNFKTNIGARPLHFAASAGNMDITKFIIEQNKRYQVKFDYLFCYHFDYTQMGDIPEKLVETFNFFIFMKNVFILFSKYINITKYCNF